MGKSPYPIYQLPSSARNGPTSDPTEVVQGEWFKDKMMGGPCIFGIGCQFLIRQKRRMKSFLKTTGVIGVTLLVCLGQVSQSRAAAVLFDNLGQPGGGFSNATVLWSSASNAYGGGTNPSQAVTVQDTVDASVTNRRFMRLQISRP